MFVPLMVLLRGSSSALSWLVLAAVAVAQDPADPDDLPGLLKEAQQKLQRGEFTAATGKFEELLDALAEEAKSAANDELGVQAQINF
jgi:hypothetical protein